MNTHSADTVRLVWSSKGHTTDSSDVKLINVERVVPRAIADVNGMGFFDGPTDRPAEISNRVIQGDNLPIMQALLDEGYAGCINVIYIDPPYFSDVDYWSNVQVGSGENQKLVQRKAFQDTWEKGIDSYLDMLYPRLKLMKKLLADDGTIFVHLDWHVSHYVKVIMDELFSPGKLINEIVWCYGGGSGAKRHFHRKHDTIFWYSKGDNYTFNPQYRPYTHGTLERGLTRVKGDRYKLNKKGALMQDWWSDINKILSPTAGENLKFPTQKPAALLQRIIGAASNPGDWVADFFGGTGTTASVCANMGRRWIVCDNSALALLTTQYRLIHGNVPFIVQQIPLTNLADPENRLELLTPVVEKYDRETVLVRVGIKYYSPGEISLPEADFSSYIEYWAVDLDYQGEFTSDYQIVRKNHRYKGSLDLSIVVRLAARDKYCMAVKVYDVFANHSIKIIEF
ncbi:MAG: DNA methyltransferase [Syntrophomonadaceae bacterium]|jgi:site-specific DNA-methyltransferase (adenine-specific)